MEHPLLLAGVGRYGDLGDTEKCVCLLYGIDDNDINCARRSLFVKAKRALEMLPPTKDALELHVARANYQAKIWINADKAIMDSDNNKAADTIGWTESLNGLEIVWKRLPAVPSCGCKKKCVSVRCKCFKSNLRCTPACGCDAVRCADPVDSAN